MGQLLDTFDFSAVFADLDRSQPRRDVLWMSVETHDAFIAAIERSRRKARFKARKARRRAIGRSRW